MFSEFMQYINKSMTKEEIVFALFGLVVLIVIWFAGASTRKSKKRKRKGNNKKCI